MSRGHRMRRCCVLKCGRTYKMHPELSFYTIPNDPKVQTKWLENLKLKRLLNKRSYVCSMHFEEKANSNRRLNKNAIPTLHLGYDGLVPHKFMKHYIIKRKCAIENCKLQFLRKHGKTFKFPDSKDERLAWAQACNLTLPLPDKELFLCQHHFERKYISNKRLRDGAFPKLFLNGEFDEDVDEIDIGSTSSDSEESESESEIKKIRCVPVKLKYSRAIKEDGCDDSSIEESEHLEQSLHEQIQNLNDQIENLRKRVIFLKNSAIYPQPGASEKSLTLARMIVGAKNIGYTEEEKELAKKLRSNMFSGDYNFLKHELGFRLPLFKAVKRNRSNKPENDGS